eukprot:45626_1
MSTDTFGYASGNSTFSFIYDQCMSTIITLFNLYYLKTTFLSCMSHKLTLLQNIMNMAHSLDISDYLKRIMLGIMALDLLRMHHGYFIFAGMNIAIGIGFLAFIRMMV